MSFSPSSTRDALIFSPTGSALACADSTLTTTETAISIPPRTPRHIRAKKGRFPVESVIDYFNQLATYHTESKDFYEQQQQLYVQQQETHAILHSPRTKGEGQPSGCGSVPHAAKIQAHKNELDRVQNLSQWLSQQARK
eukprot:TRINITY_DN67745_c2_g1_i3.p2 TRINITY_DN67745_c2_g1~~TRINITY_DN67745_c2_g1_i3.p2  ORF type:complete len:139 (+),score=17.62 TRINITY_DN67745_c2_g1_i3:309-725(+)